MYCLISLVRYTLRCDADVNIFYYFHKIVITITNVFNVFDCLHVAMVADSQAVCSIVFLQ